jgi:MFS family permease
MLGRGGLMWLLFVSIPWYALELGAGPVELGIVTALQSLPTLFIAPLGGVVADRLHRPRVLIGCQLLSAVVAGALSLATVVGVVTIPILMLGALSLGVITALELPVRQTYLTELVPPDLATNAVALHSTAWNTARFIGPGLAGLLIATVGIAATFAFAAVVAVIVAWTILVIERRPWHRRPRPAVTARVLESLREGAAHAARDPLIRWALVFVTAGGILGIQTFQTLAPLYATDELGLGAGGYGALISVWGLGAVIAAYGIAWFAHGDRRWWLVAGGMGMAVTLAALAVVNLIPVAFLLAAVLGVCQIALVQNALISVQQAAPDAMRGRVMGLYTTVFQGFSPFGALLAGVTASLLGVPGAMLLASIALACVMVAGAVGMWRSRAASPTATA